MGSGNNYKIRLFTSEIQERKTAKKSEFLDERPQLTSF